MSRFLGPRLQRGRDGGAVDLGLASQARLGRAYSAQGGGPGEGGAGIPACLFFPAQTGMSTPPCCPRRPFRAGGAVQSSLGRSEAKS